jgi:N-acetyl-anhydromuramyl-L-alanine amidase AmpD
MGSRRGLALAASLAGALVAASAAAGASLNVLIRHSPNVTQSNRTRRTIDAIVVHATEGHFVGSVRWLEQARSRGSAHFVVSRAGQIVQLVPVTDVAWHSGNARWNLHSIGIEHEGWTSRGGFTLAEYRASAELVAYLAHRWGIPLDRRHIVGHDEVPDPRRPGRFGGVDEHRDPGRHWNWTLYMSLVRHYAAHPVAPRFRRGGTIRETPPAPARVPRVTPRPVPAGRTVVHAAPLHATALPRPRSVVRPGATLHRSALWYSGIDAARRRRKHIYRVDFLVDGKLLWRDNTWPFAFHRTVGLNTRTLPNGRHLLTVRAYGTHHYRIRKSIRVRVSNPVPRLAVRGVPPRRLVTGVVQLAVTSNARERVALYVDGKAVSRDGRAPYTLSWDASAATQGPHTLLVYGRDRFGHRSTRTLTVTVAVAPSFPAALGRAELAD